MRKLLRLMGRDLAAGITSAATPAEAADAWSFGLAALCWMGICTAAARASDKPRRA